MNSFQQPEPIQFWSGMRRPSTLFKNSAENDTSAIGIQPTTGSRALGIVQTAVFNAVNAFDREYDSYLGLDPGTPTEGASEDAAVAGAAVTALASVFPGSEFSQ